MTSDLVSVPRSVFQKYWRLPWVEVVDAAKRGVDGLMFEDETAPDTAVLREGDGRQKGRTLLYRQNWVAP